MLVAHKTELVIMTSHELSVNSIEPDWSCLLYTSDAADE